MSSRQRRERTAFVMQQMDIQLYMHTVEEELLFSAPRSVPKAERKTGATHWLEVFGLSHLKDRHPHSLSGGEKQRLVVACAMMKRPSLMILDEPTSGLDGRNMRIIARELKEYAARGGAVLLITHDLELLELAADFRLEISRAELPQGEVG
jgi:energy-coupling factor transport system ATP-binding protein